MQESILYVPISGMFCLIIAVLMYVYIKKQPNDSSILRETEGMIHEGVMFFLKRNSLFLLILIAALTFFLSFFLGQGKTSVFFVSGSFCSLLGSYIALKASIRANSCIIETRKSSGAAKAFLICFFSGSIMGLTMAGLGLIGLGVLVLYYGIEPSTVKSMLGFTFGASTTALFIRVSSGLFTQAAVTGMDLAEEIEVGIPVHDPRNPGVIVKNVGKNIRDIAGMVSDLFDSFSGAIVATIIIGVIISLGGDNAVFSSETDSHLFAYLSTDVFKLNFGTIPLLIVMIGLFGSLAGIFSIKYFNQSGSVSALKKSGFLAAVLFIFLSTITVGIMDMSLGILGAILSGLLYGTIHILYSAYSNSEMRISPFAEQSRNGASNLIISGFAKGMKSMSLNVIVLCLVILIAYKAAGLYGVGLCSIGVLAMISIIMTIIAYGSLDNSVDSFLTMAGPEYENSDIIKSRRAGNEKSPVTGEGFAIGATAVTALGLFIAFTMVAEIKIINIKDPRIIAGFLLGAVLPVIYSSLTVISVERIADRHLKEIRRQFREIPGLLEGKDRAVGDTKRCISLISRSAFGQIITPILITLVCPAGIGFIFGKEFLGGMLLGSTVIGVILSFFLTNSGRLLGNVREYIERGRIGGKGSHNHRAAVIGDRVGNPFRNIISEGMIILVKPMLAVSILIAPKLPGEGLIFRILGHFS